LARYESPHEPRRKKYLRPRSIYSLRQNRSKSSILILVMQLFRYKLQLSRRHSRYPKKDRFPSVNVGKPALHAEATLYKGAF